MRTILKHKGLALFLITLVYGGLGVSAKDFSLMRNNPVFISIDSDEDSVVWTAFEMFSRDYQAVFGGEVILAKASKAQIIVRTNPSVSEKSQAFLLEVNKKGRLTITGSDKRGTAYGLLELSRLIGVSPWEWWADVTPEPLDKFTLLAGYRNEQSPSVEYRGIFINDEDAGFVPWATKTYDHPKEKGRITPKVHARIFELLLRLRANTFWPAMHSCSEPFFLTPGNLETARKYGIYIGTSHCEPMACNVNGEWKRRAKGEYNYFTNRDEVLHFFQQRVDELRDKGAEAIYTLGMRGYHDGAMIGVKDTKEYKEALDRVLLDQRQMLDQKAPQVFIPYKEVLDVYNEGLDIPDDVTLLWCDDNYGYLTHFPTEVERLRSGGNGLYYHVSYWGRPKYNVWFGSMSPSVMWQQLNEAYQRGMQRMWILNVGDIKPSEYLTELFLDMAWNINSVQANTIHRHGRQFLTREFGQRAADSLAPVMEEYAQLTHILRPEMLDGRRIEEKDPQWKDIHDIPWTESYIRRRLADFQKLSDVVEETEKIISPSRLDAYFQLVKFPVQTSAQVNRKYLTAQLARHRLSSWEPTVSAHDSIESLSTKYNKGKWHGMMPYRIKWMPIYDAVKHDTLNTPMMPEESVITFNATDSHSDGLMVVEGLGLNGGAAITTKDIPVVFDLPDIDSDSITVEVRLLPTYPVSGEYLRFSVNGNIFDYQEVDRTEEWKRNVTRNYAKRSVRLPKTRQITFIPLAEGVVLDQITIKRN